MPTSSRNVRLSEQEASRIIAQAEAGSLDLKQPEIARIVGDARRTRYRAQLWGDRDDHAHRRRVRNVFVGGVVFTIFCIIGLLVPLAISLATY